MINPWSRAANGKESIAYKAMRQYFKSSTSQADHVALVALSQSTAAAMDRGDVSCFGTDAFHAAMRWPASCRRQHAREEHGK